MEGEEGTSSQIKNLQGEGGEGNSQGGGEEGTSSQIKNLQGGGEGGSDHSGMNPCSFLGKDRFSDPAKG